MFQQNETVNTEMKNVASQITQLAEGIANLNDAIRAVSANNVGQLPNDLLDQRDEAVRQLAEMVGIQVIQESDLTFNIFVGNGQPLVIGGDSFEVASQTSPRWMLFFSSASTQGIAFH